MYYLSKYIHFRTPSILRRQYNGKKTHAMDTPLNSNTALGGGKKLRTEILGKRELIYLLLVIRKEGKVLRKTEVRSFKKRQPGGGIKVIFRVASHLMLEIFDILLGSSLNYTVCLYMSHIWVSVIVIRDNKNDI